MNFWQNVPITKNFKSKFMSTELIVFYILCGTEGSAVADQFLDVFENSQELEDQNTNALRTIAERLKKLKDAPALSAVRDDIEDFETQITDFLNK